MNYVQSLGYLLRRPHQMLRPVLALWEWLFPVSPTPTQTPTSSNTLGMEYMPQVGEVIHHSRNAIVARLDDNIVLKYSRYAWWEYPESDQQRQVRDAKKSFYVEEEILKVLGDHPRIVRFLGSYKPQGLKFAEADLGNLQQYIKCHTTITQDTQAGWFVQASEAIKYIHSKGVIHSDLRPENFLLSSQPDGHINLRLCDFGGSKYGDLYGENLPDAGFYNPALGIKPTEAIDLFSLGSVFFTISSGSWPYWREGDNSESYQERVDDLFSQGKFPLVDDLFAGPIIMKCWTGEYATACQLLEDCRQLYASLRNVEG